MTQKEERLKHRRKLSATEKLLKVKELKAQGKTQVEVAAELEISRKTVCLYWNSKKTISKQQAIADARQAKKLPKRKWKLRGKYGQTGYMREKLYGVTVEQYDDLFLKQEGKCAICGTHQDDLTVGLAVDHSHVTSKIRGLLCFRCNYALGLFKDNALFLTNAITYLASD